MWKLQDTACHVLDGPQAWPSPQTVAARLPGATSACFQPVCTQELASYQPVRNIISKSILLSRITPSRQSQTEIRRWLCAGHLCPPFPSNGLWH